jgi:hypothetical protein
VVGGAVGVGELGAAIDHAGDLHLVPMRRRLVRTPITVEHLNLLAAEHAHDLRAVTQLEILEDAVDIAVVGLIVSTP